MSKRISTNDHKEIKAAQEFLKRMGRGGLAMMMTEERWQKYVGLTPREGWLFAKSEKEKDQLNSIFP